MIGCTLVDQRLYVEPDQAEAAHTGLLRLAGTRGAPADLLFATDFAAAVAQFGWDCSETVDGRLLLQVWRDVDAPWSSRDDLLVATIAPFVSRGCFLEMLDDDYRLSRLFFTGFEAIFQDAIVTWPEDPSEPSAPSTAVGAAGLDLD